MRFIFVCMTLVFTWSGVANGTQVIVRVLNVSSASGTVRVAFCKEAEWKSHECATGTQVVASKGAVSVYLNVTPGLYGILVHHDLNGDNQINKSVIGIPVEGVGFSRNPRILFGFPTFSSVSILIDGKSVSNDVTLLFEPTGASLEGI